MDWILLDWTRMGSAYCLAGVVHDGGGYRVVRPLLAHHRRETNVRNAGWSAYLMDGHRRWEVFELAGASPAAPEPPHLEDVWVRGLRSRRCLADPSARRAVLEATASPPGGPLFAAPAVTAGARAYLAPGTGGRSLVGVVVPAERMTFTATAHDGRTDFRVLLPLPEVGERVLAVKDHHLLSRVEAACPDAAGRGRALAEAVRALGPRVAVRLGLSRAFSGGDGCPEGCWLMANGFFSPDNRQP